jgi:hypothetical protein
MADRERKSKLENLSKQERETLIERLKKAQTNKINDKEECICYVCRKTINFQVHKTDIDHIVALTLGGLDEEANWGLTHDTCNRSKGARDLRLQRILYEFREHVQNYTEETAASNTRNFTLSEALEKLKPERQEVGIILQRDHIQISWNENDQPKSESYTLMEEPCNPPAKSFVARIPFVCLHHDKEINPRSIVDLEPMIEEFYNGYPQLQPSLATLTVKGTKGKAQILVFDGQHKAAAQLYARQDRLFVRVFMNYDRDRLKETNYRAHTKLAQVHFPQLINDRVGADLFKQDFDRFLQKNDLTKASEETFFRNYLNHAQRSEFRTYFNNYLRYEVLIGKAGTEQNNILNFTETVTARSKRFPLSYDALQKTFLDLLLYKKPAKEFIVKTERFRQLEKENLVRLMNLFVEEIFAGRRFDLNMGIYRIEDRLARDPNSIPNNHLRAYRLSRRAPMVIWASELKRAIQTLLNTKLRYQPANWGERRPLWVTIHSEDWQQIRRMIRAIRDHKIWGERTNPEIMTAIASTKQKDWSEILLKGTLPSRQGKLLPPLDANYIFSNATRAA